MRGLTGVLQHTPAYLPPTLVALVCAGVFALAVSGSPSIALPVDPDHQPVAECATPTGLLPSEKLPRVAERVAHGEPIKIVAFGSSSTFGTGASSTQATYPSQMQEALSRLFPNSEITVVNRGVPGERVSDMIKRFRRDVLEEKPDLLLWQTGTNSALAHGDIGNYVDDLAHGVDRAKARGIDVILMTPQLGPRFEAAPQKEAYLDYITRLASFRNIPVIRRYDIMQYWAASGEMTAAELIGPDGLHMTDRSYHCLGVTAARIIAAGASVPPAPVIVAGQE